MVELVGLELIEANVVVCFLILGPFAYNLASLEAKYTALEYLERGIYQRAQNLPNTLDIYLQWNSYPDHLLGKIDVNNIGK